MTGSGLVNHIALRSINEAILFLMRKGVKAVLHDLEPEIAAARDEHAAWQEVVRFFSRKSRSGLGTADQLPRRHARAQTGR